MHSSSLASSGGALIICLALATACSSKAANPAAGGIAGVVAAAGASAGHGASSGGIGGIGGDQLGATAGAIGGGAGSSQAGGGDPTADVAAWVDPLIGTGGLVPEPAGANTTFEAIAGEKPKYPFGGLTYPGAVVPFGMVALSPDVQRDGLAWVAGYNYYDDTILGFSHMKTSGNGQAFGHVLFVPSVGKLELLPGDSPEQGYRTHFSHQQEHAQAGYYAVTLSDETGAAIGVELTATVHAGMHRYTFPKTDTARVLIDLIHGVGAWGKVREAHVAQVNATEIEGRRWAEVDKGPVYFVAQFSRPFLRFGIAKDALPAPGLMQATGSQVQAFAEFDATQDPTLVARVGLSWVSNEAARANLLAEIPSFDFDTTRAAARAAWNQALGRVQLTGGSDAQRRTFYTALYHAQLSPFEFADRDGKYLGADGAIHTAPYTNYTFFSLWDTFRAVHPLLSLLQPERVTPIVSSLLAFADQNGGLLPTWGLAGFDWGNMVGLHALPVIAEAYGKGFRGFDAQHALALMQENLQRDLVGLKSYRALGYVAADQETRSAAATLELAYDDWSTAKLTRELGGDATSFQTRAASYRNVFDSNVGFMRGRFSDGGWRAPFDPRTISHYGPDDDFVEANSWQYSWFVPHDVKGLIASMGGQSAFIQKLDQVFEQPTELLGRYSADVSGLWGQYAQGNEQSHHIAYLYAWVGAPWKTQMRVREIMQRFYNDQPAGLPGNDDAGQMSAWYVFSALGLYPVDPVSGEYVLGSPLFERAVLDVGSGKRFVIVARDNAPDHPYIQSAKLNEAPFDRSFLRHSEIVSGGTLELVMGPAPNKLWASSPEAAPSSMTAAP